MALPNQRGAAMEAFRQRAAQGSPTQGGVPSQGQPPTSQGQVPTPQAPNGAPTAGQSAGGIQQLKQSQPDEATLILKALIARLKSLSEPQGGPTSVQV